MIYNFLKFLLCPPLNPKSRNLRLFYKISSILSQTFDFESAAHPILEMEESTMGVVQTEPNPSIAQAFALHYSLQVSNMES